jgi:glutamine synthetase
MMTLEEIRQQFDKNEIRRIKLGAFDIDSTLRGKYISTEKFLSAAQSGLSFCDVIFGWDIGDLLYDNVKFTGWHTGYPDANCRIALDTLRLIPWEPGTALFLMDFVGHDGKPLPIAPRQVLERPQGWATRRIFPPSMSFSSSAKHPKACAPRIFAI